MLEHVPIERLALTMGRDAPSNRRFKMSKKEFIGQVTGNMTLLGSKDYPADLKAKVLAVDAGKVRKFEKLLVDPEKLPEDLRNQVMAALEADDSTAAVPLRGTVRLSKASKSLTCSVCFKVSNVHSIIGDAKVSKEETDVEILESLL